MGIFDRIGTDGCRIFTQWIKGLETEVFESLLGTVHAFLAEASVTNERYPRSLTGAVKFLSLFSSANETRAVPLDISLFYAHKLIRKLNFKDEYLRWKKASKDKGQSFAFFNYPFLLDPIAKTRILHIDAMLKMSLEYEQACVGQAMIQSAQRFIDNATLMEDYEKKMNDMNNPFLVLEIRREHLVQDTITHLSNKREYRKPLKVKFIAGGEEGLDQGGVQKEFFQLFTSQLLDPALGMFSYDEETRLSWFRHGSLESLKIFECLGTIVGLALYNGVMLGTAFPIIMYKKLLSEEITFADFKQSFPQLSSGLEQLLNWSGNDVQQIFMRTFQIDIESFGVIECYDLVENGGTIWVTETNREEFVRLYIDFYVNKSIEKQFKSFQRGFFKVCSSQALSLCRPQELELLLCGKMTSDIDFIELEKGATYDDGYGPNHQVIRWFWEIVHEMDTNHKKFLLEFVTASDRIPLRGLGSLMFVIQRNGPDSNRLPTSLTCFGRFLLPEYSSSEKLKRMVYLAIENAKGFGLV